LNVETAQSGQGPEGDVEGFSVIITDGEGDNNSPGDGLHQVNLIMSKKLIWSDPFADLPKVQR
jgi:hypothetical protein